MASRKLGCILQWLDAEVVCFDMTHLVALACERSVAARPVAVKPFTVRVVDFQVSLEVG